MLNRLILLSGPISSGKTTLARGLAEHYGFGIFKTSDVIRSKIHNGSEANRKTLQDEGDKYDKETNGQWVLNELKKWAKSNSSYIGVIVDSVRIIEQIKAINESFWPHVLHIHLTAAKAELERRYSARSKAGPDASSIYENVKENSTLPIS